MAKQNRLIEYVKLLRPWQWYKNLAIFLALLFTEEILKLHPFLITLLGFVALCLMSSANYAINDIIDMKKDRLHPEKKSRPLASGKISKAEAISIAGLFFIASMILSYFAGIAFMLFISALFLLTLAYSLWFKHEPVLDVVIIATNFVIRAVSGAYIIKAFVSPWLILCPFFLALFLAVSKRQSEISLTSKTYRHNTVLMEYNKDLLHSLTIISETCLLISYSLYAFTRSSFMLLTIPFALYTIVRFQMLVIAGSEIARFPQRFYKDWKFTLGILLWALSVVFVLYFMIGR